MPNALTNLLSTQTLLRSSTNYETVYDDFVRFAGGNRLSEVMSIPPNTKNSDYILRTPTFELVFELKQITSYAKEKSVDEYFAQLQAQGKLLAATQISSTRIRIGPHSLSESDWNRFYKKFRPTIVDRLKDANKQLKATSAFLPLPEVERFHGVVLLNSGDYNLSNELLLRLVEWRMHHEWKRGKLSALDFVICATVDLLRPGGMPFDAKQVVRTTTNTNLMQGVRHLFEKWIYYNAEAVGASVERGPDINPGDRPAELPGAFAGKIQLKISEPESP